MTVVMAVHVHTKSNLPERDCQGQQTLAEAVRSAELADFDGVAFTPHASNPQPGQPRRFTAADPLAVALLKHNQQVRDLRRSRADKGKGDMLLMAGVEANILNDGGIDLPSEVAADCELVIASLHGDMPNHAAAVEYRLMQVCGDPNVDVLGHPQRYAGDLGVMWERVFERAAATGTAIEANFNAWHSYGPNKARRKLGADDVHRAIGAEYEFYRLLGESGASVVLSLDVHNAGMWPHDNQAEAWMPTNAQFEEFLRLLELLNVTEKLLDDSIELATWAGQPKASR